MDTEHNCVWDGDRRFLQSRRKEVDTRFDQADIEG